MATALSATIDSIAIAGFGSDQSYKGSGSNLIKTYNGGPLYCHATGDAHGITIAVDENPPSSYVQVTGPVKSISVTWARGTDPEQTIKWAAVGAGATYDPAFPLEFHLEFAPDLSTATLKITKPGKAMSTTNSLGLIVLGKPLTGGAPQGYFVNVPMKLTTTGDPTQYSSMSIAWADGPGGAAGPIGGGQIP